MTDKEREQFHKAVNLLKEDKNVTLNKFDILGNVHARWSTAAAAHNGPGFLGWHRVFLLMMENALRQKSENVTIPYWDTTLDAGMSKPYYSVIWSEQFLGTGGGVVTKGPFKNWTTPHGLGKLRRMIYAQGKLMNHKDIKRIMKKRHLNDISFPNANPKNNIEEIHNQAHQWVGGQMRKIEHSAYDPSFYVLHSFVDFLWEEFRNLQKRDGVNPNMDYPKDYGIASHSPLAPMGLGKLVVMDGLSDIWLQGIQYSPRPQCNATHTDYSRYNIRT
ncbi:hypothetical protein KUTeg_019397 [Tegillarca granosa]|uniref:Tyrosinase copper-binding domain-containing protein n=1 Tax=Tegillarca granosa TaxID=220873 RepID=A0ABQ9EEY9_TEGGR|nr:hypothetical protein KUTeg_019397 [Tegillarca granosa]